MSSTPDTPKVSAFTTAVRVLAPVVPLALALAHPLMTGTNTASPVAPTAVSSNGPAGNPISSTSPDCSVSGVPCPMLSKGHPVDWWFVFKLNAGSFPGCAEGAVACPFGGDPDQHTKYSGPYGLQYAFASNEAPTLQPGNKECLGGTTDDPVGATFDEVYNGNFYYVMWNDQTYLDPKIPSCTSASCSGPWGHSKGIVAWNDAGQGFVMQVSTPSWPGSGNMKFPRKSDGNTLGCVKDNDVEVSQHFFSTKLSEPDLELVLEGLQNSSVATNISDPQMVHSGGPAQVQKIVSTMGQKVANDTVVSGTLSSGIGFISKPSAMGVPPWQMVSATLGGVDLRVANWWVIQDALYDSTADTPMNCWDDSLGKPGAVASAATGSWQGKTIGLRGGPNPNGNHAKIGVTTSGTNHFAIFGDMNQEGSYGGNCKASQNGRGGTFYVVNNPALWASVTSLIAGESIGPPPQ